MLAGRSARDPRQSFGERLALARQQAGLTQQQLAEKLGTRQRVITHREREQMALCANQLTALADALGLTTDYLVGRDSPKKRGNGPVDRARRGFEALSRLPRHRQQRIIEFVETLVAG